VVMSCSYCKYLSLLTVAFIFTSSLVARADVGAPTNESKVVMESAVDVMETSWLDEAVTPVTNPVWFEDARITTEARFIAMYHEIDDDFITQGGDIQLYALQLRYAITDKLAFIAVKDGLVDFNPDAGNDQFDFADIAAGLKYQVYRNDDLQLVVTPGLTFEIPIGAEDVFQGNGDGMFRPFVSVLKGFDKLRLAGNTGFHIPIDFDAETAQYHWSLHADYEVHKYFIPLVELNGYTTLTEAERVGPLQSEGFDVINFGAGDAVGDTNVTVGVGFRSKVYKGAELGFAWEKEVTSGDDLFDYRFTMDLLYRF
jgi:hypothetical protein